MVAHKADHLLLFDGHLQGSNDAFQRNTEQEQQQQYTHIYTPEPKERNLRLRCARRPEPTKHNLERDGNETATARGRAHLIVRLQPILIQQSLVRRQRDGLVAAALRRKP